MLCIAFAQLNCTLQWTTSLDITLSHKCNRFIIFLLSNQANKGKTKSFVKCHVRRRSNVLVTQYFLLHDFFSSLDKLQISAEKGLI